MWEHARNVSGSALESLTNCSGFPEWRPVLSDAFVYARDVVTRLGFSDEIEWQDSVSLAQLDETTFLEEYTWVVLSSGMKEAVVRKKFPLISECFHRWSSAEKIASDAERCVQDALAVFRHEPKIRAVVFTAQLIANQSFFAFKENLFATPWRTLRALPYIGPVTQFHLAKNIGLDVAKPDRHLVRMAALFGYSTAEDFCREVAAEVGYKVGVVDLVFWRFATLNSNYQEVLRQFV